MTEDVLGVAVLILVLALLYCFLNFVFIAYYRAKLAYVQGLLSLIQHGQKETRAESA